MKFALASDLHLSFGGCYFENTEGAETLILAGDIYEVSELKHLDQFSWVYMSLKSICANFKNVLWILGNHEHYGSKLSLTAKTLKKWLEDHKEDFSNVTVLDNESVHYDDVSVHGTTLWTNIDKGNPVAVSEVSRRMNDYNFIEKEFGVNIRAFNTIEEFTKSMKFLDSAIIKFHKNVVVTHHHPTNLGLDPRYGNDILSFGYHSDLSEFILDRPEIKAWCSGHIHRKTDVTIGDTRIMCNPRGYRHESIARTFTPLFFDV